MSARMLTSTPSSKVVSASGAAGVASSLMIVFLWGAAEVWPNHPIPLVVQGALLALATALCTWLAGYFCPPSARDQVVLDAPAPPLTAK